MRGAAAFILGAALALAACGGSASRHPDLPVRKVASRLPALRGLHFRRVPSVEVVSKSEFERIAKRQVLVRLRSLTPQEHQRARVLDLQARVAGQLPVLLGLVTRLPSAATVGKAAALEGVYTSTNDRVFLISDTVKQRKQAESVLSHELTHALEEQNLGALQPRLQAPAADAADARRAVVEGSATLTQLRYAQRYLGGRAVADKLREPPPDLLASRLARFVEDEADFTYRRGAAFVRALQRRGGHALVDRALRNPPVTTASIFDPSRWPAHDRARPPAGHVSPGPGWARSFSGSFGAEPTHELLFLTGPATVVPRLVRDWEGGTVEIWQRPEDARRHAKPTRAGCVTVVRWRWRAAADAVAARGAVDPYLRKAFGARPAANGVWRWTGGGAALVPSGTTTTLVIAPSLAIAAATAAGGS